MSQFSISLKLSDFIGATQITVAPYFFVLSFFKPFFEGVGAKRLGRTQQGRWELRLSSPGDQNAQFSFSSKTHWFSRVGHKPEES